jgi:hypothetical protein
MQGEILEVGVLTMPCEVVRIGRGATNLLIWRTRSYSGIALPKRALEGWR